MARLSEHRKAGFVKRMIAEAGASWPEECALIGAERLDAAVAAMVDRALAYGFNIEYDTARFVTLCFASRNARFDLLPWAVPLVGEKDVPGRVRMNRLWDAARQALA